MSRDITFLPITCQGSILTSGVTLPFGAPLLIFCHPHKFFTVSKKQNKKGRHFFFGFSYRLFAPLELFLPQIFFSRRPNAKLAEIWYILLLCQKIFRLKNCKFGNMPPPLRCRPLHSRGSRGGRYATDLNTTSCGVIRNQRSKIRRSYTSLSAGGRFRKISKFECRVI